MEIRFLTADDASEWWRLWGEALRGRPGGFQPVGGRPPISGLEEVKARLGSEREDHFVVGAFEQRPSGMAGFYREKGLKSRDKGCVWGVYVTPGKGREGVGRSILHNPVAAWR